jgi:excinuclease ABC subunit B
MAEFKLHTNYQPSGDQPEAIKQLVDGVKEKVPFQTLLGITGSGKTFTMANVIQQCQKPTLIISHNKTLAAQLYGEFKGFFPENAVEYFISYYDYYQPEAYLPVTDTFIEKDMSMNEEIDKLRLKATSSLLTRKDVIVVASVSCIYGLGDPEDYKNSVVLVEKGKSYNQRTLFRDLVDIYYKRNDISLQRGTFRARGDVIEIFPAYWNEAIRLEFWGNQLSEIHKIHAVTGDRIESMPSAVFFPARHFVTTDEKMKAAIGRIEIELQERLAEYRESGQLLEAQRIEQRTRFDLEMLQEVGFCSGVENYSRHITNRNPGQQPFTLLDFFPDDFMIIIDESHVTLPQFRAMYLGDLSRKENLVEYGFRLPSAKDNRPLKFIEFEDYLKQVVFVSATPADYELEKSQGVVVEQVIRPTGLMDPIIEVHPSEGQIDHLINEIHERIAKKHRILVTTLTKRMAEDLTDYLVNFGLRVRYMHSEIETVQRIAILRDLRLGEFDVLIGINLLREGLDLPEVSLVAVLDADKQGFLRSEKSLLQISGRAARNVEGKVIFYGDRISDAMQKVIDITDYRREKQRKFNQEHGITPKTIYKSTDDIMDITSVADSLGEKHDKAVAEDLTKYGKRDKINEQILDLMRQDMLKAAENLQFERATQLRDEIRSIEKEMKKNN